MHILKINNKNINEWGMVTTVTYPPFSNSNIYKERAEKPEIYRKRKNQSRLINCKILIKDQTKAPFTMQKDLESKIYTELNTENPTWIEIDGRFFYGILEAVEWEETYNGIFTATFKDLLGRFYSAEKSQVLQDGSNTLNIEGVEVSRVARFIVRPTSENVTIKYNSGRVDIKSVSTTLDLIVNVNEKIVSQAGVYKEIDTHTLLWEPLKIGNNQIILINANGTLLYREVLG